MTKLNPHSNKDLVRNWRLLSYEEQAAHNRYCNLLIQYLEQNPDKKVLWTEINKFVEHIYKFVFDSYNSYANSGFTLNFDDEGVYLLRRTRV